MKQRKSVRIFAALLLLCTVLPFLPLATLFEVLAADATLTDNVLIYDDFQNENMDYTDESGNYLTTHEGGALRIEKTSNAANGALTAYLLPYDALTGGYAKLTVSFSFSVVKSEGNPSALYLAYAANQNSANTLSAAYHNYGFGGMRVDGGTECSGHTTNGVQNRQYRTHYLEDGAKTTPEYLMTGVHTMTIQLTAGAAPRVYVDGCRYLAGTTAGNEEIWHDKRSDFYETLNGKFGIDLWKAGNIVQIDNFLVYEGHGTLPAAPTSTVSGTQSSEQILVYDDFSDPNRFAYADASETWGAVNESTGKTATTSEITDGKLILDGRYDTDAGASIGNSYYRLPYTIPEGTTVFTAEITFSVEDYADIYKHLADIMLTYGGPEGADTAGQVLHFAGMRVGYYIWGDGNATNGYADRPNKDEHWGTLTGKNPIGNLYTKSSTSRVQNAGTLADGMNHSFTEGQTYTMVVQVKSDKVHAFVKEFPDTATTIDTAWSTTYTCSDISGSIGLHCRQQIKLAIDKIVVYDGIRNPNVEENATSYIYEDFSSPSLYTYPSDSELTANPTTVSSCVVNGNVIKDYGALTLKRVTDYGKKYNLPVSLPSGTYSFTADLQFSVDVLPNCDCGDNCQHHIDIFLTYGETEDGYWGGGIRVAKTGVFEHIFYRTASGEHYRCFIKIDGAPGWKDWATDTTVDGEVQKSVYTMRLTVTPGHQRVYLIDSQGTAYTSSQADNCYSWDASSFLPQHVYCSTKGSGAGTPTASDTIMFRNSRDGAIGIFNSYHFYRTTGATFDSTVPTTSFHTLKIAYQKTEEVATTGTTLWAEDFADASADAVYGTDNAQHQSTVSNGVLSLTTKAEGTGAAYMLPVTLSGVNSFTAEITFAVTGSGIPELFLLYGAPKDKNGNLTNQQGWLSGYRLADGTEWLASVQGDGVWRGAYRAAKSGARVLGYASGNELLVPGRQYKMIIEVKNGAANCYVEGYSQYDIDSDHLYHISSLTDPENGIRMNAATVGSTAGTNVTLTEFANILDGGIGLYNDAADTTLLIDSIVISAGISVAAESKRVPDGTVLYENDFSDAVLADYTGEEGYTAALVDGALSLKREGGSSGTLFRLPNSHISGAQSMTVTFDFFAPSGSFASSSTTQLFFGYDANGNAAYRYSGLRFGQANATGLLAFEHFGRFDDGTEYRYYRNYIKTSGTSLTVGEGGTEGYYHFDFEGTDATDRTQWHTMTVVITGSKAVVYIDGERQLHLVDSDGSPNTAVKNCRKENFRSGDIDVSQIGNVLTGGMLGFALSGVGTEVLIDNVLCVAGTTNIENGGVSAEQALAAYGAIPTVNIDAERDALYNNATALSTAGNVYAAAGVSVATADARVLWNVGTLSVCAEVIDSTKTNADAVTFYFDETRSLSYRTGTAYSVTVYRSGAYVISNSALADEILVEVAENTLGWTIELQVPLLTQQENVLSAGDSIGFNYVVSDKNTSDVLVGWSSWTPGQGTFYLTPDGLSRLTLAYTATPTADTVATPTVVACMAFAAVVLVGVLGVAYVLRRSRLQRA